MNFFAIMRALVIFYCCPGMALGIFSGAIVTPEIEQEYPWHVTLVTYAGERRSHIGRVICGGVLATKRCEERKYPFS